MRVIIICEVDAARAGLWKAAGNRKDLIGEIVGHKSPGKKGNIHKAMLILKENEAL